jgi:hypothetical protein
MQVEAKMVVAGSMALYVVVLPAVKSARLDGGMLERVAQIAVQGKPTLVCFNQFSRYMDMWDNAQEADQACADILQSIVEVAPVAKDFVQVCLTEFWEFDKHAPDFEARNIKSVEHVSFHPILLSEPSSFTWLQLHIQHWTLIKSLRWLLLCTQQDCTARCWQRCTRAV